MVGDALRMSSSDGSPASSAQQLFLPAAKNAHTSWVSGSLSLPLFSLSLFSLLPCSRLCFFLVVCVDIIIIFPLSSSYSHSLCLEAVSSIFLLLLRIPDEAVSRQEPPQQVQQHSTGEQTITTRTDALRAFKRQEISSAASVFFYKRKQKQRILIGFFLLFKGTREKPQGDEQVLLQAADKTRQDM